MLNIAARTGDASNLANLSGEVLKKFNVRGNGRFRIDQDGESALVKWIRKDRFKPVSVFADGQLDDLTLPSEDKGIFEKALGASVDRTWVAPGGPGETTRRLTGPVQFVRKLMDSWRLDNGDVVRLLGCDPEDFEYISAVLDGRRQLRGRDVRDRIAHLFCIRRTLWSLFQDLDVENDWLRERHSMLNGKSPMSLIIEGSIEDLLLAREYVESAAGVR